jgi:ribosomal 50S subunit-recycling heat shock protein
MRLDKYLKVSRLIKRRTLARDACVARRVSVNGKQAKAGADVSPGDIIDVRFGNGAMKARVLSIAENTRKNEAAEMYEILSEESL